MIFLIREGVVYSWKFLVIVFFLKVLFYLSYKEIIIVFYWVFLFEDKFLVDGNYRIIELVGGIFFLGYRIF